MGLIIILSSVIFILFIITEFASLITYRWFIPEKKLNKYFSKEEVIKEYISNGAGSDIIYGHRLPYIAKMPPNFSSKWYIRETGRIPRWSKYSKYITELYNSLNKPKKSIFEEIIKK